ncbi:TPA: toxin of the YeeV-YeeU toxin-antitoxin system, partial [Escherichia coli]|nr:toxin of the YeeV-YeeU toxin-antitoxin system [Escherichia coli]
MWLRLSGCLSDARNEKLTLQNSLLLRPGALQHHSPQNLISHIRKIFSMKTLP